MPSSNVHSTKSSHKGKKRRSHKPREASRTSILAGAGGKPGETPYEEAGEIGFEGLQAMQSGVEPDLALEDDASSVHAATPSGAPRKRRTSALALLGFGALTAATAIVGALATSSSVKSPWYRVFLRKPSYQPPSWLFGPVWTGLYATMAVSAWRVWKAPPSTSRTRALALWGGQLALNGAWSWAFFGARKPAAGLVDIVALDTAIGAYTWEAAKIDRPAAWLMAPYIGWTGFATVLNGSIVRLNA